MSDHQSMCQGRGRGTPAASQSDSSTHATSAGSVSKRSVDGDRGETGLKRGMVRDNRPRMIYTTKPSTVASKEGQSGKVVNLSANYFSLIKKPSFAFALYRVDFEPEIDLIMMRKAFLNQIKSSIGGYIYDGGNILFLTRQLPKDLSRFEVSSREGQAYSVIIKKTGQVIQPEDSNAMMVLNVILRKLMGGLNMQQVGRNLYDPQNSVNIKEFKIELWPGYVTSIRQHEKQVLVCAEVSHKVMRMETVYDILRELSRNERSWQDAFKKEVIGMTVLTDYNNKTYKVDDVSFTDSPSNTFERKGETLTFYDYYQRQYNRTIRDRNQPMLVSNPKARDVRRGQSQAVLLVPELCRTTGLTEKMRGNFQMMRAMADHTQMVPSTRINRLLDLSRRLHSAKECKEVMENFNTDVDNSLVKFKGRALPQEVMIYGDNRTSQNNDRVDWTDSLRSNPMYTAIPLKRWFLMYPSKMASEVKNFLENMHQAARGMTYDMAEPRSIVLSDDRTPTYVKQLQDAIGKDPRLIVIIVPNNNADRYAAIKRMTCVDHTIPTQVVVGRTLTPKKGGVLSIATKVMIQINCKLGGAPWMVKFPLKGTMTIGFDVTHNTRDRRISYGAFVASMDLREKVQYFSSVFEHRDGAEVSSNMSVSFSNALRCYKMAHGSLPERIFFYRDGVGDGQIEYVHREEVKALKDTMAGIYTKHGIEKGPMFSFIIVSKRINTRIFQESPRGPTNPVSGTVVDNTITLPERYDFFLVSQSVRQGTVSPTSYNIIYDTNGLTPDKMQMLTYKQTHLYYNWSGCTRVPAVVQYSHKLALLVGESLHQIPSASWQNSLYFL